MGQPTNLGSSHAWRWDPDAAPESESDLALRCAALTSAFAAARGEIDRLNEALRQKSEEADNLRSSTAILMRERDDARRLVCDEWHDPAAGALHHGWVGLYPEAASEPWRCDGSPAQCVYPLARVQAHNGCGVWCEHFEPEDAKP
jgi:hypothetical protein